MLAVCADDKPRVFIVVLTEQEVAHRSVTKTQVEVENGDGTEEEMAQKVML